MAVALLLGWAMLACASGEPRSAAEIEQAVQEYLSQQSDLRLDLMRIRADRIRYDGDRAVATVSFVAEDDPKAAMKMIYELHLDGGRWRVVPATGGGGTPTAGPHEGSESPVLPPGHPPMREVQPSLPPGHPPLDPGGP